LSTKNGHINKGQKGAFVGTCIAVHIV
jgi:hypothetical protein